MSPETKAIKRQYRRENYIETIEEVTRTTLMFDPVTGNVKEKHFTRQYPRYRKRRRGAPSLKEWARRQSRHDHWAHRWLMRKAGIQD